MSEQLHSFNLGPEAPHEQIILDQYSNGAKHLYAVENRKKVHISHDQYLEAYGYDPKDSKDNWNLRNQPQLSDSKEAIMLSSSKEAVITTSQINTETTPESAGSEEKNEDSLMGVAKEVLEMYKALDLDSLSADEKAQVDESIAQLREVAGVDESVEPGQQNARNTKGKVSKDSEDKKSLVRVPRSEAIERKDTSPKTPDAYDPSQEVIRARDELAVNLSVARDEYVRRVAGNARRSWHLKKDFRKSGVQEARKAYEEAREKLSVFEIGLLREDESNSRENKADLVVCAAFSENRRLAERLRQYRLEATGNYKFENGGNTLVGVEKRGLKGIANKFYEWYGRNNAGAGKGRMFMKHSTVGAGFAVAGAGMGLLLTPVGVGALGVAGGAAVANRIAKAYMSAHIRKRSQETAGNIGQFATNQRDELYADLGNGTNKVKMTDLIEGQRRREVRRNRVRQAGTIALAAVAGTAGAEIGSHLLNLDGIDIDDKILGKLGLNGHAHGGVENGQTASKGHGTGLSTNHGGLTGGESNTDHASAQNNGHGANRHGEVKDFQAGVNVEAGHGYSHEIQDIFATRGMNLSPEESFAIYNHLTQKFPGMHGDFFTSADSYRMSDGNWGIDEPGRTQWRPEVLAELNKIAEDYGK